MKDIRDWFDVIFKVIVAIAAVIVGYYFSSQKQQNEDLKFLTDLVTSTEQPKRLMGASLTKAYLLQKRLPGDYLSSIYVYANIQNDITFQKVINDSVTQISEVDTSAKHELDQADIILPIRIYFHIRKRNDEKLAQDAKKWIESSSSDLGNSIIVPSIQFISGIQKKSILKCFKKTECNEVGQKLVSLFKSYNIDIELRDQSKEYKNSTSIRPNHFEVWFAEDLSENTTHPN